MLEILTLIAVGILILMAWLLYKAKKFTQFKRYISTTIQPTLIAQIKQELEHSRSTLQPNTPCHIKAALLFWTCSRARILQAALERDIVTQEWLKKTGNYRNCQHLFHVERDMLLAQNRIKPIANYDKKGD